MEDGKEIVEVSNDEKKIDGLTALFSQDEVHGFTIKEWSISQFSQLYPYLKIAFQPMIDKGLNFEDLEGFLKENYPDILDALVPIASDVIKISCPKQKDKVDELSWSNGCVVVGCIVKRNLDHVADFFGQFVQLSKSEDPTKTNS